MKRVHTSKYFNYNQDFKKIDFRKNPQLYQIGRGEQGVLLVEPYKSEMLPYWRFKTPEIALRSAQKIYKLFNDYKRNKEFAGMDMARKFLQMGYTRSRRYANHKNGIKYVKNPQAEPTVEAEKTARMRIRPQEESSLTSEKAESARIFYSYYLKAKSDPYYISMKAEHKTVQITHLND